MAREKEAIEELISFLDTIEQETATNSLGTDRNKELSLSLQIQAYLNTASDELYANGKPLYSEERLKDIHSCMKMWVKLHNNYFYQKQKPLDLEKEIEEMASRVSCCDFCHESDIIEREEWCREQFRYFYELGKNAK